jgi:hypothetical protein
MPPRIRLTFAALSLISFVVAAVPLYGELSRRSDIWWTPHAMLVPLGKSSDRVEIYARGKPFAALLQAGQLRLADDGGSSTLVTSECRPPFQQLGPGPSRTAPAAACVRRSLWRHRVHVSADSDRTPRLPRREGKVKLLGEFRIAIGH